MTDEMVQFWFDYMIEIGVPNRLTKGDSNKWSTYLATWLCLSQWSSHYF